MKSAYIAPDMRIREALAGATGMHTSSGRMTLTALMLKMSLNIEDLRSTTLLSPSESIGSAMSAMSPSIR